MGDAMKLILILLMITTKASASEKNFIELWEMVQKNSDYLKSVAATRELKKLELERSKRHWLPRVMLGAQNYTTNDPGKVFFGLMGQGAVEQTDFAPATLNDPDNETFTNASLMVDLPLYEGGIKSKQAEMQTKLYESAEYADKAAKTKSYVELLQDYGMISVNSLNDKHLASLEGSLNNLLAKYKLGSKQSPVGYSGLLGLKGVLNKVQALRNGFSADSDLREEIISFKSGEKVKVKPITTLKEFLAQNAKTKKQTSSSKLKEFSLQVESYDAYADMEKARFLPQVGVFASADQYQGDRDSNTTQTVGVYLKWDLFNNDSYGRVSEARQKIKATRKHYQFAKKQEEAYRSSVERTLDKLGSNLDLIEKSLKIVNEQIEVSLKLYRQGSINGIQMAQIFDNKVDLILQKQQLEQKLIETNAKNYQLNN